MRPARPSPATITKTIIGRIAPSLRKSIVGAKATDTVEFGFFVDGAWEYQKLGTVAEIVQLLTENKVR